MKKIVTISGAFDRLDKKDVHLIREALKLAVGSHLMVLLYKGYENFVDFGFFPMQSFKQRKNNLCYFAPEENIKIRPHTLDSIAQEYGNDLLFVHYGDDKDFPGRPILKKHGIRIKFIKPYVKA